MTQHAHKDGSGPVGIVDECFKLIEHHTDKICDLRKRWDDRLVLEAGSLPEHYVDGNISIVLEGKWAVGPYNVDWMCRISTASAVPITTGPKLSVDTRDFGQGDGGQDKVMFIVVVESMEGPEILVPSIGRANLVQEQVCRPGEGDLYRFEVWNGLPGGGYKFIPPSSHREMTAAGPRARLPNACGKMIQGPAKIVQCVTDDQREQFGDWFKREVLQLPIGWLRIGWDSARVDAQAVPFRAQGPSLGSNLSNVLLGPLNL